MIRGTAFWVTIAGWSAMDACGGTTPDRGLDALLHVEDAQFFRGPMPVESQGPSVAAVNLVTNEAHAGSRNKSCSGALAAQATAAAISLEGDRGYWVVGASVPDVQTPGLPSFHTKLSFASSLSAGPHALFVRAVDASGRFGAAALQSLTTMDLAPSGRVVVSLAWDTESDLDLRVLDPSGAEIWKRNINSFGPPAPGQAPGSSAWMDGGILDFDSNAACVIDGRRKENVIWKKTAPSGHYVVKVDTFSLCNEVSAHWNVEARVDGATIGKAAGTSFDSDTQFSHDRGAGLLALEFDVP